MPEKTEREPAVAGIFGQPGQNSSVLQTEGQQAKASIYDIIQAQLLQRLERAWDAKEPFHWVKPWTGAPYPCSYDSPEKSFSNPVNLLLLDTGEYLTFSRIAELHEADPSIRIRKGARQAYVYQSFPVFQKDENGIIVTDEDGKPVIEGYRLRYTREFHVSDIENLKSHFVLKEYRHTEDENMKLCEQVIQAYVAKYGIDFREMYANGAAYSMGKIVVVPARTQYRSIAEFYSTVFHELAHSTKNFLERGKKEYTQEELVAEISASMLCGMMRIGTEESLGNSTEYIGYWYEKVKNADARTIYFAVTEARKAVDLIVDSCPGIRERIMEQSGFALVHGEETAIEQGERFQEQQEERTATRTEERMEGTCTVLKTGGRGNGRWTRTR